jgi:hypothetical protein
MNLSNDPTFEQFRDLLRQHDDRARHHVLWVRKDGEVLLSCLPNEKPSRVPVWEHPEMRLRYDTFSAGYGYVAAEQPEDDGWFRGEMFMHIREQWARLKGAAGMTHVKSPTAANTCWAQSAS